jgi:glutamate--cysteine ligase
MLALGFAALAEGLFYGGPEILDELEETVSGWPYAERMAFHEDCARRGLAAVAPTGNTAADIARWLVALAHRGLEAVAPADVKYLQPVADLAEEGQSPAVEVLEKWHGEWDGSATALLKARTISC